VKLKLTAIFIGEDFTSRADDDRSLRSRNHRFGALLGAEMASWLG
jgi:hypothetical protein